MTRGSGYEVEIKLPVSDLGGVRRRLRTLGARPGPRLYEANVLFDTPEKSLRRRGMLLRLRVERAAGRGAVAGKPANLRAALNGVLFGAGREKNRTNRESAAKAASTGTGETGKLHRTALVTFKGPAPGRPQRGARKENTRTSRQPAYKVRREWEFRIADSAAFRQVLAALGFEPSFYYERHRTMYRLRQFPRLVVDLDETPIGVFLELEGPRRAIDRVRKALGYRRGDAILASYGALYLAHCRKRGIRPRDMLFGKPARD
jgi:adenylate cyclase class 2